jgi:hypothetical protein
MILKYRTWLLQEKKMVGVSNILFVGVGMVRTLCNDDKDCDNLLRVIGSDCVVMQSIGLFDGTKWEDLSETERESHKKEDWHGREIYEGDIITTPWGTKATVEREKFIGGYKPFLTSDKDKYGMYPFEGKVVGNIYEGNIYERKKALED